MTISTEIAGNVGKPAQPIFDLALAKAGPCRGQRAVDLRDRRRRARHRGARLRLACDPDQARGGACQRGDGECVASLAGLLALSAAAGRHRRHQPATSRRRRELVDGLWAVPIDITRITRRAAIRRRDADRAPATRRSSSASAATPAARSSTCARRRRRAWLDGAAVPVADIAPHDFGGGAGAELRVLERVLDAGSNAHAARSRTASACRRPRRSGRTCRAITWSAGPRLVVQLRIHRPRARPLPRSLRSGEPGLRPIRADRSNVQVDRHGDRAHADHQRHGDDARREPLAHHVPGPLHGAVAAAGTARRRHAAERHAQRSAAGLRQRPSR